MDRTHGNPFRLPPIDRAAGGVRGSRRRFVFRGLALIVGAAIVPAARAQPAAGRTATVSAMKAAWERENEVVHRYRAYGAKARQDGHLGVAYLFVAFAAAEQVHADNFARVLARLKVELPPPPRPAVRVGTTRENLMSAVDGEIDSIDAFYPKLLEETRTEGDAEAMAMVSYAWSSEQQHRDRIRQLQRWTGTFFEKVAKHIDDKTGQYYVCAACGSTVNEMPRDACPVCKGAIANYRHVAPPA
jgi:rubrerythrin